MKFKLVTEHTFWWPVSISVPADHGRVEVQKFEMKFRAIPLDEAERGLDEKNGVRGEVELLNRVCLDWDDSVVAEDGQPIPFSMPDLHDALQMPWVRTGLIRAYLDALSRDGARAKN